MLELNAVIFDMDGLMIDTEPVGKMLVKTSHERFGYEITEDMFYHLIGTNEKTSKAYYHSVFGEDYPYQKIKDYRDQLRKEYFNSHPLEVKKGLYDLLEDLKKKNIKMAVASSTRYERVLSNLKSIKVDHYFDAIIGGDQIQHGKPAPDIFLKAVELLGVTYANKSKAKLLGVSKEDALVLEDSKNGILAAHAGNIPVICIPDLIHHSKDILDLTVGCYDSLDQLIDVIVKKDDKA